MAQETEQFTGADATGGDGDENRTITLSNEDLTQSTWFTVFVSGLAISLTTDYTVVHNNVGSVITFLNALFDDTPIIVNYQTGLTDDINSLYCSSDQVAAFLQVPTFDGTTSPTKTDVDSLILENTELIEQKTMNAWRETIVTKEYHTIKYPNIRYEGTKIFFENRNIKTLDSNEGDLLEVFNGSTWENYLTTRNEGRTKDYWVDEEDGILWIRTYPRYIKRTFDIRLTYRFGENNLSKDIRKACIRLTAADILQSDDKSVLFPEGSSNIPLPDKASKWERQAKEIIRDNRELKVVII